MILIVGLGNPGKQYATTPHNMGFRVLDCFKARFLSSQDWTRGKTAMYLKGEVEGKEVTLLKPRQYMNRSGFSIKDFVKIRTRPSVRTFLTSPVGEVPPESLWVAHDELDLPWGEIKVDVDRSSAGHKGVKSIIDALGTKAFWRFRVGVRPMAWLADTDEYLVSFNTKKHMRATDDAVVQKTAELVFSSLSEGIGKKKIVVEVPPIVS
ncbi:MAG: peptidyl-tRNA hydrolase [Candidatus Colwellbacteria bacterium]|nr:peptidyl-tRNA hydrolase [Candidatus Colwellbacteria bacterium]